MMSRKILQTKQNSQGEQPEVQPDQKSIKENDPDVQSEENTNGGLTKPWVYEIQFKFCPQIL